MSKNGQPPDPTGEEIDAFIEKRAAIPPDEWLPYAGKQVAWSIEDARIIASGDDMDEVEKKVIAVGVAPNRVVFGYIDDPEAPFFG